MLQKNVLDYLDSSAARFPINWLLPMKPVPSPSASCGPAPGAWAPRWPIWVPSTTGPWRCWSTTPRPTWPPSLGCWKPDISMSPWTFKCLCPGCGGILETLSPAALVYPAGEETLAQALADLCPVLCAEEGFAHPPPGRPAGCPPGAGAGHRPGVRHFHLRLHRHPQGDRHRPPQRH